MSAREAKGERPAGMTKILLSLTVILGLPIALTIGIFLGRITGTKVIAIATAPELRSELRTEDDYVQHLSVIIQGKIEHVLQDKTRVDLLTDTLAIEVDFAPKWYEAVGQSLHYARLSGRKPGIILIVRDPKEEKYANAAIETLKDQDITLIIFRNYN
jgi:hypothetical protein